MRYSKHTRHKRICNSLAVMIWRSGRNANCDYFNDTWLTFAGRTLGAGDRSRAFFERRSLASFG